MLSKVSLLKEVNEIDQLYVYKKIGFLNHHALSVVQVENRTLDFHIHERSDELFYVIEGQFHLETEDGLIEVSQGEFIIVPKNTLHRPVVNKLTKFLMIELEGTLNKENSGDLYAD
ncbi:cupin domain-containing protein [Acetanaerobacterium elongatum]|uniref:Cupin domain-containing protein n=1 Tax=Acetanaerobacterium elongatum TaxID=258515 RepID=A0A1G9W8V2_9FIRM|nr:cupin domain-containing protein [Acetanaerobacterium elongatum]SDM80435.1 Cupin domain-containing protein [Acetanaerobacterium elongatum]